ncbi:hypothetical protein PR048_020010 [Dryococelus australis]|uniref:Uncharacterized protein n=1 Tax=Dryococelus australis TaxID=614101 RepID=A0ABQ9H573_9NEOP|nr:hypothetical protein PR048_020010 [Dryococelus australis]
MSGFGFSLLFAYLWVVGWQPVHPMQEDTALELNKGLVFIRKVTAADRYQGIYVHMDGSKAERASLSIQVRYARAKRANPPSPTGVIPVASVRNGGNILPASHGQELPVVPATERMNQCHPRTPTPLYYLLFGATPLSCVRGDAVARQKNVTHDSCRLTPMLRWREQGVKLIIEEWKKNYGRIKVEFNLPKSTLKGTLSYHESILQAAKECGASCSKWQKVHNNKSEAVENALIQGFHEARAANIPLVCGMEDLKASWGVSSSPTKHTRPKKCDQVLASKLYKQAATSRSWHHTPCEVYLRQCLQHGTWSEVKQSKTASEKLALPNLNPVMEKKGQSEDITPGDWKLLTNDEISLDQFYQCDENLLTTEVIYIEEIYREETVSKQAADDDDGEEQEIETNLGATSMSKQLSRPFARCKEPLLYSDWLYITARFSLAISPLGSHWLEAKAVRCEGREQSKGGEKPNKWPGALKNRTSSRDSREETLQALSIPQGHLHNLRHDTPHWHQMTPVRHPVSGHLPYTSTAAEELTHQDGDAAWQCTLDCQPNKTMPPPHLGSPAYLPGTLVSVTHSNTQCHSRSQSCVITLTLAVVYSAGNRKVCLPVAIMFGSSPALGIMFQERFNVVFAPNVVQLEQNMKNKVQLLLLKKSESHTVNLAWWQYSERFLNLLIALYRRPQLRTYEVLEEVLGNHWCDRYLQVEQRLDLIPRCECSQDEGSKRKHLQMPRDSKHLSNISNTTPTGVGQLD